MQFSIRSVHEHDAASIAELLNTIIGAGVYTVMDEPMTADDQLGFIRSLPEHAIYHAAICEDTGKVLGLQEVLPVHPGTRAFRHVGEIGTFVALDAHGNGIGRELSAVTFRTAGELGYLKLQAMIRADNPGALAFYRKQGFSVVGTYARHAFVGGRYIDEIIAEKFLA